MGVFPVENVLRACWHIGFVFLFDGGGVPLQALAPAVPEKGCDGTGQDENDHDDGCSDCSLADAPLGGGARSVIVRDAAHISASIAIADEGRGRMLSCGLRYEGEQVRSYRLIRIHCWLKAQLQPLDTSSGQMRQPLESVWLVVWRGWKRRGAWSNMVGKGKRGKERGGTKRDCEGARKGESRALRWPARCERCRRDKEQRSSVGRGRSLPPGVYPAIQYPRWSHPSRSCHTRHPPTGVPALGSWHPPRQTTRTCPSSPRSIRTSVPLVEQYNTAAIDTSSSSRGHQVEHEDRR